MDQCGVVGATGGGELALVDLSVELLVDLELDGVEQALVSRLHDANPVGLGVTDSARRRAYMLPSLWPTTSSLPVSTSGCWLRNRYAAAAWAMKSWSVMDPGWVAESAGTSLAGEVFVEAQGNDALPGEYVGDQFQGAGHGLWGLVAVAVGGPAARNQQGGGQLLGATVRGDLQRAVGDGALARERHVQAGNPSCCGPGRRLTGVAVVTADAHAAGTRGE